MDLDLTDEQRAVVQTTRAFVQRELVPHEDAVERLLACVGDQRASYLLPVVAGERTECQAGSDLRGIATGGFPAVAALYASADQREGAQAFAEKRPPVWKGY